MPRPVEQVLHAVAGHVDEELARSPRGEHHDFAVVSAFEGPQSLGEHSALEPATVPRNAHQACQGRLQARLHVKNYR